MRPNRPIFLSKNIGGEVAYQPEHKVINMNNRIRKNKHEGAVQSWFFKNGYESLARGWPDFVFFKMLPDEKIEAIFVEVKPPDRSMIKPDQHMIKEIFKRLGIEVKVAFGILEDGSPNFQELVGRKIPKPKKTPKYVNASIW